MLRDLFSLFPAYAGVILEFFNRRTAVLPFPRIRGGDPYEALRNKPKINFSPHTRG